MKRGGSWVEDGYKDPHELAMEKLIENKKRGIERKKKLEEELYSLELDEWIKSLNPNELEKIAPPKKGVDITPQRSRLSLFFKENIWNIKKRDLIII